MISGLPWQFGGYDSELPLKRELFRFLVRGLRFHMPCGTAKKKKKILDLEGRKDLPEGASTQGCVRVHSVLNFV